MPPPDPEHDATLIERSWHDPEAFAGLYDRRAAPLHRYAARRLSAGAARNIVADTFLDAFRKRRRYDLTVSDARPWLYGIAANLIGKHGRAEGGRASLRRTGACARAGERRQMETKPVSGPVRTGSRRVDSECGRVAACDLAGSGDNRGYRGCAGPGAGGDSRRF